MKTRPKHWYVEPRSLTCFTSLGGAIVGVYHPSATVRRYSGPLALKAAQRFIDSCRNNGKKVRGYAKVKDAPAFCASEDFPNGKRE